MDGAETTSSGTVHSITFNCNWKSSATGVVDSWIGSGGASYSAKGLPLPVFAPVFPEFLCQVIKLLSPDVIF